MIEQSESVACIGSVIIGVMLVAIAWLALVMLKPKLNPEKVSSSIADEFQDNLVRAGTIDSVGLTSVRIYDNCDQLIFWLENPKDLRLDTVEFLASRLRGKLVISQEVRVVADGIEKEYHRFADYVIVFYKFYELEKYLVVDKDGKKVKRSNDKELAVGLAQVFNGGVYEKPDREDVIWPLIYTNDSREETV